MIDNATLLIGIAFSSVALIVALMVGWFNARRETYLVHGAAGIMLVVIALATLGLRNGRYDLVFQLIPFFVLLIGFSLIYSSARLFRDPRSRHWPPIALGFATATLMAIPLVAGYSGTGTILLNLFGAVLMSLSALEFWRGRAEQQVAMVTNAALYGLTAVSFSLCAMVLLVNRQWILTAPPSNWAEDINSIMSLFGLTGIGAITLTLHHARAARRHHNEANTDALTGVFNRRALFSRYPETEPANGLSVLMFDLDHFKQINDRLGHARGDLVLQAFAEVMREQLRPADFIARLGGEEFCVILPGLDGASAMRTAERIRLALAERALPNGRDNGVATVSAGLATAGLDEPFSSVLSRADAALYKAKQAGRNQVHLAALRLVA